MKPADLDTLHQMLIGQGALLSQHDQALINPSGDYQYVFIESVCPTESNLHSTLTTCPKSLLSARELFVQLQNATMVISGPAEPFWYNVH